jgi:hypothetical protein
VADTLLAVPQYVQNSQAGGVHESFIQLNL